MFSKMTLLGAELGITTPCGVVQGGVVRGVLPHHPFPNSGANGRSCSA
jgi:hypothetical protein